MFINCTIKQKKGGGVYDHYKKRLYYLFSVQYHNCTQLFMMKKKKRIKKVGKKCWLCEEEQREDGIRFTWSRYRYC